MTTSIKLGTVCCLTEVENLPVLITMTCLVDFDTNFRSGFLCTCYEGNCFQLFDYEQGQNVPFAAITEGDGDAFRLSGISDNFEFFVLDSFQLSPRELFALQQQHGINFWLDSNYVSGKNEVQKVRQQANL